MPPNHQNFPKNENSSNRQRRVLILVSRHHVGVANLGTRKISDGKNFEDLEIYFKEFWSFRRENFGKIMDFGDFVREI